ncbi:MAG: amidohydrolase family protein, partial [Candidatus Binatia bacterium]|nr:amidohydrolase family protein [Candidatus Binatia bacterium]
AQAFLFDRMYPFEGIQERDDVLVSASLAAIELLSHGVTCFIDPGNYHPGETVKAVAESGIRAIIAKSSMDIARSAFGTLPPLFQETTESALASGVEVVERFHNSHNGRIMASLSFRGVNNCTDDLIVKMKEQADRKGVLLQAHACFAKETRDASLRQHSLPEIERLGSIGVLGPNLLLIHCGWLSPKEPVLLRKFDVKVIACASSSLHNAYGNILMGSIPELLEMGVVVAVGSDHACSGIVDLPTEMFLLSSAYKEVRLDPKILPPEKTMEMATLNGSACALLQKEIGSLEAGKKADLAIFRTDLCDWLPIYNPVSNFVYAAPGASAGTVIVDGTVVMEDGKILTLNEQAIYKAVLERQSHILESTGLKDKIAPKWPLI